MTNHNTELNKHQKPILSAKYLQLSKYTELSDIELAVVAGGEGPRSSCNDLACTRYQSSAPLIQNAKRYT
jgi:hypothetical protein